MKFATFIFTLALIFAPLQVGSVDNERKPEVITIFADQVTSAVDIEMAITNATAKGTRPGTVILDGSKGPFRLTADDKSINIFVSNITLRGQNNAIVTGCDDGLFFDDFPLKHILVEEITFNCFGDCVDAPVSFQDVTIRNNLFQVGGSGILVHGPSRDWVISNNMIQARDNGIWIINGQQMMIACNHLAGGITGILLQSASAIQVRRNFIDAVTQGIFLEQEAWNNLVQGNSILGVHQAGIVLSPDVMNNRVLANRVLCADGTSCQTVSAGEAASEKNKIEGNRP